jgi:hypothetical protein
MDLLHPLIHNQTSSSIHVLTMPGSINREVFQL